ncbi:MAG: hypothetical protein KIG88_03735 [Weeksellaceae bacterium]|nr:hypothetical protein [Weeksellaceae bacterium]
MIVKKWIKISSIVLASVIAILFVLSYFITILIHQQLPNIIAEKNDTPYNFSYQEVDFSILRSSLSLNDIEVSPKDSTTIKDSIDVTGKIKQIDVVGVNFFKLFKNKELAALKIKIKQPEVNYYQPSVKAKKDTTEVKVGQSIDINSLEIEGGNFNLFSSSGKDRLARVQNINIDFDGIYFNKRTVEKKIPFQFSKFKIEVDTMVFRMNNYQYMVSSHVKWSDEELILNDYRLKPIQKDGTKYAPNVTDADIFDIESPKLVLTKTDWGFDNQDKFYFKSDLIKFSNPTINIIAAKAANKQEKSNVKINKSDAELINVKRFEIENGSVKMWYPDASKPKFYINNVVCNIDGIKMNSITKASEIPIDYKTFKIKLDSMYYELNEVQYLRAAKLDFTTKNLVLQDFKMKPLIKNNQFKNNYTSSNTLLDIEAPILKMNNNEWGFNNSQFYFKTNAIKLDDVKVQIINQKNEKTIAKNAEKAAKKFLINFDLIVDTIQVKKSQFIANKKFDFKNVNITILGLKNFYSKELIANQLIVKNPNFTLFGQPERVAQREAVTPNSFNDIIKIRNTSVQNGTLNMIPYGRKNPNLTLKTFNLDFKNIKFDPTTIKNSIPFLYDNVLLHSKGLDFEMNEIYQLNTNDLKFHNGDLLVNNFKLIPKISRSAFVSNLKKEQDLYTLTINQITGKQVKWNIDEKKDFNLNANLFTLNGLDANIFRSKTPPDDTSRKSMFSEKLRKMKFGLAIKQLDIVQSKLEYAEEGPNSIGSGKLTFSNINAIGKNINSGFKKKSLPDLTLDWKSNFMGGNMFVKWVFNPMHTAENFSIKGHIKNLPMQNMDPFLRPYLKVSAEGNFDEVNFNINGNDNIANGKFDISYNNLKLNLLKDDMSERKVLSAIANVAVSKNTAGNKKEAEIKGVERDHQKSFFNFFLASLLDGLKQTLLIF